MRYDGEDLDEVGALTGLGRDGRRRRAHGPDVDGRLHRLRARASATSSGEDDRLHVPRRSTPRTRVPAGAVGLAGEYSGVYPRASPGGWQLIGRTDLALWDLDRDPPALLTPGARVRFTQIG